MLLKCKSLDGCGGEYGSFKAVNSNFIKEIYIAQFEASYFVVADAVEAGLRHEFLKDCLPHEGELFNFGEFKTLEEAENFLEELIDKCNR